MRIKLDTGGISDLDQNRGIGIYAAEMIKRLPAVVTLTEDKPDLVHALVYKIFSPRRFSRPFVITVHDLIPLKYPKAYPPGIKGRIMWQVNKLILRQAAGVITDSQASKKDIINLSGIPAEKINVIYLAVDEIFKPMKADLPAQTGNKFKLPPKFILYVGDLNWNKNVVGLTRACLKLKYPLVVVGRQAVDENYNQAHPETRELVEFQHLAKANPKKIIRLGLLSNEDLLQIYNFATVYIQSSRDEGFGLPVLEAMSCGCPVLSSGKGSLPEITGRAALNFSPANLKLLWNNQTIRQQLFEAGLKQAKKFSWNKTIKETVKVYEKIITGSDSL